MPVKQLGLSFAVSLILFGAQTPLVAQMPGMSPDEQKVENAVAQAGPTAVEAGSGRFGALWTRYFGEACRLGTRLNCYPARLGSRGDKVVSVSDVSTPSTSPQ